MTFTRKILVGLGAGVAVGLFFGESASVLKWVADGFVKLLQMTVLPYVTLSIVTSLGSLSYEQARTLGMRAGAVLGGLWAIALLYAFLIPLAFPDVDSAMFFSTALVERRPAFNFVDLYIPSNPFNSLANNIVPAVVLFSVIVGVALIGVERKQKLLDVLETAGEAVSRATRSIVRLTPVWPVRHRGHGRRHAQHRAAGAAAGVPPHLRGRGAAAEPLGPARPGGGAHADPGAGDVQPDAQRVDHRVCRRGPVHRAAGADRGQPDADRAARAAVARGGRPARRAGARLVQLSAHRQAAVDQLHRCLPAGSRMRPCRSTTTRNWP